MAAKKKATSRKAKPRKIGSLETYAQKCVGKGKNRSGAVCTQLSDEIFANREVMEKSLAAALKDRAQRQHERRMAAHNRKIQKLNTGR